MAEGGVEGGVLLRALHGDAVIVDPRGHEVLDHGHMQLALVRYGQRAIVVRNLCAARLSMSSWFAVARRRAQELPHGGS